MLFNSKSIFYYKADILRKTVVGYMEETMETTDDQDSRVLKKPLPSLKSNSHQKETCLYFAAHSWTILLKRM